MGLKRKSRFKFCVLRRYICVAALPFVFLPSAFSQFAYECTPDSGRPFISKTPCPAGMEWMKIKTDPYYVEPKAATRAPSNVTPSPQTGNDARSKQQKSSDDRMQKIVQIAQDAASKVNPHNSVAIYQATISVLSGLGEAASENRMRKIVQAADETAGRAGPTNYVAIFRATIEALSRLEGAHTTTQE